MADERHQENGERPVAQILITLDLQTRGVKVEGALPPAGGV